MTHEPTLATTDPQTQHPETQERAREASRSSESSSSLPRPRHTPARGLVHPVVLLDPRCESLAVVRSLRSQGIPISVVSSRRLEPALYARGVSRHRVPALALHPTRWEALLLELAARLEPRPIVFACSKPALALLQEIGHKLAPHYDLGNGPSCDLGGNGSDLLDPELALRRAVLRGEPALEVQLTLDRTGHCTGLGVLAWTPATTSEVLVTSVRGERIDARSTSYLRERQHQGYARLIWAPDRFGALELQTMSTVPGPGLALALEDGVDFWLLAYAVACGLRVPVQKPRLQLSRKLAISEPEVPGQSLNLVELPTRPTPKDPWPWIASLLRGFVRP